VTNPNLVKEILTNKLYYKEPTSIMAKLAFFGEGLLTMNDKNWVECHKIMEHAFHHEALKVPFQTINDKDDRKHLLSEKCYALKCKRINVKIVVVLI
jgi:cytochrome P450